LSRLAVWSHQGKKGTDWSLALASLWKNPKTGRIAPDPQKPRIVIDAQNSKMAFIKLGSILNKAEWPKEGRFLDMRTLGWALRNRSFNLNGACKAFKVKGKRDYKPSGKINPQEIEYCREDVGATHRVLNAMMAEFNRNPIDLHPDKSYSPASIAKAYLKEMGIKQPKLHFGVSNKAVGIAMQSYYGGRAECRIRRTPVPVIHTDSTSQYPTVNALLGNWNVLTSSSVRFVEHTAGARNLLTETRLSDTFKRDFWKQRHPSGQNGVRKRAQHEDSKHRPQLLEFQDTDLVCRSRLDCKQNPYGKNSPNPHGCSDDPGRTTKESKKDQSGRDGGNKTGRNGFLPHGNRAKGLSQKEKQSVSRVLESAREFRKLRPVCGS